MDTLLLLLPLEKQNLSSNSHLNLSVSHNINECIQQYNVPGLKEDTLHTTKQYFWSIKQQLIMNE